MKSAERKIKFRLFLCLMSFMAGFFTLSLRVWQLHLGSDDRVSRLKDRQVQYTAKSTLRRGNVYDSKGRELAMSVKMPSVFVDPEMLEAQPQNVKILSKILGVSTAYTQAKMSQGSRRFAWIRRYADESVRTRLKNLDGVFVTDEWKRIYPEKELAAQVVGLVAQNGRGQDGIESMYNEYLRTQDTEVRSEKDAKGRAIYSNDTDISEGREGADIYLTLDATIQTMVEREIRAAARASQSKSAIGVVMDPYSGNVLAMASYPPVDPNRTDALDPAWMKNQALVDIFEPGSTFKIFTVAAALENGVLSPGKLYDCREGSLKIGSKVIRNIIKKDLLNAEGILTYSNNVGTARIGLELGAKRFEKTLRGLGFGEKTGVHFPMESRGLLKPASTWKPIDLANISFGQGVGVTALQMAVGVSAIANGGYKVFPNLVEKAIFPDGSEKVFADEIDRERVMSPKTADLVTRWMETVVEKGTGSRAKIDGIRVAGKTGTAQVVDDATGRYSGKLVNATFAGFAPSDRPRLAAIFVFREPKDSEHGGELAAPVFKNVISQALAYLKVESAPTMASASLLPKSVGRTAGSEKADAPIQRSALSAPAGQLPDFKGMTMREVLTRANAMAVRVRVVGSGIAVRQEPSAGAAVSESSAVRVYFQNPRQRKPL